MAKVHLGLMMSLDGFINDRNGSVERLYPDLEALGKTELLQEIIRTTGAVGMGRHAFAMGDPDSYADGYEFQTPIFVLTKAIPAKHPKENEKLKFTFVTDGIESAIGQAKAAAGNRNVAVIGGADTAQQCLRAGLVDELQIGIMPVLFGEGLRLFEHIDTAKIKLERTRVIEAAGATYLSFRVVREN